MTDAATDTPAPPLDPRQRMIQIMHRVLGQRVRAGQATPVAIPAGQMADALMAEMGGVPVLPPYEPELFAARGWFGQNVPASADLEAIRSMEADAGITVTTTGNRIGVTLDDDHVVLGLDLTDAMSIVLTDSIALTRGHAVDLALHILAAAYAEEVPGDDR